MELRTEWAIEVTEPDGLFRADSPLRSGVAVQRFSSCEDAVAHVEWLKDCHVEADARAGGEDLKTGNEWHLQAARFARTSYRVLKRQVGPWSVDSSVEVVEQT